MRYWDDMQTKYGFSDGNAIPPDAEVCREIYVRTMNLLLEKHESKVRVMPYDRPGTHNPLLIVNVPVDLFKDKEGFNPPDKWEEPNADEPYQLACSEAMGMFLDDYVETKVQVAGDFEDFLMTIAD